MDLTTFTSQVRDGYQLAVIAQRLQQLHQTQLTLLKQQAQALQDAQQQRLNDNHTTQQPLAELAQASARIQQRLDHSHQQAKYWQQLFTQLEGLHQTSNGIKQLLQPLPTLIEQLNTQPWPAAPAQPNSAPPNTRYLPQEIALQAFEGTILLESKDFLINPDASKRLHQSIEDLLIQQIKPQTPADNAQLKGVMDSFYQNAAALADTLDYTQHDILATQKKLMQLGLDFQDPQAQQTLKHLIVQAQALRANPADLIDHFANIRPLLAHSKQPEENAQSRAQYFDFITYTHKTAGMDPNLLNATLSSLQSLSPTNLLASGEAYDLISMSTRLSLAPNQFIPVTEHLYKAFHNEQQRARLRDQGVPETALASFSRFADHLAQLNATGQTDSALAQLYTLLPRSQVNLLQATQPQDLLTALPNYPQDYQGANERYAATERDSISNDTQILKRSLENLYTNQGEHTTLLTLAGLSAALIALHQGLKQLRTVFNSRQNPNANPNAPDAQTARSGTGQRAQVFWLKRIYRLLVARLGQDGADPRRRKRRTKPNTSKRGKRTGLTPPKALSAPKDIPVSGTSGAKKLLKGLGGPLGRTASLASTLPTLYQGLQQPMTAETQRLLGQETGGFFGGMGGAALGASLGTLLLPGIGTLIGGAIGGLIGGEIGEVVGEAAGDNLSNSDTDSAPSTTPGLNPLGLNAVPLPASLYPPKPLTQAPLTPAPANNSLVTGQRPLPAPINFAPVFNLSVSGDPDPSTVERLKRDCQRWLSEQRQQLNQSSGMEFYDAYN